ncbi:MAG: glycosyl hydrolase family 3, partial [Synechococcaceae bacterium WB9_3_282]|nr:glycosyl hydrolase family 3 [Synechococcaceae bacterium WB9_3_282]
QGSKGLQGPGVNLIRVDSSLACAPLPLAAPALLRPEAAGFKTTLIDGRSQALKLDSLAPGPVLLQLFVRGNPFRGSAGADGYWAEVVQTLLKQQKLAGLVVYGSPYLWQELQQLLPKNLPAAYSPAQMPGAQALALEALGLGAARHEGGFTN